MRHDGHPHNRPTALNDTVSRSTQPQHPTSTSQQPTTHPLPPTATTRPWHYSTFHSKSLTLPMYLSD
ncbi:hypothetical protein Pmani_036674 [Petrolisthes manimaculis]|uniref:Uncharacterized protein n=1 Tax=Petrolisthes manimaculis TaxID=1843537 RepID=A0AAE1NIX9_9EUCA|nr:hypothetical protein Pmani_036674 [Petrolisthes manimaculis]